MPGPTLLACCHPPFAQSECEGNVPTDQIQKKKKKKTLLGHFNIQYLGPRSSTIEYSF
jgi:hypothetical protein